MGSSDSSDDGPTFRAAARRHWSKIVSPFGRVSRETQFVITLLIGIASIFSQFVDFSGLSRYADVPEISNVVVLLGVFGIVSAQTWQLRRWFNRVEDDIQDMTTSSEFATDGGTGDPIDTLLLFASGAFLGAALGQWLFPEYTFAIAMFLAGSLIYLFGKDASE